MRKILVILISYWCLSPITVAQEVSASSSGISPFATTEHASDFSETVVPITSAKVKIRPSLGVSGTIDSKLDIEANFGTGFCLDTECGFIVTNYHVAATTSTDKIERDKIIHRYLATGPKDEGATANFIQNVGAIAYATNRDLAIFELERPLTHHQGLSFSLDELETGQKVDIYGFPKGSISPVRKLTRFAAAFEGLTTSGLLAFDYQSTSDKAIHIAGSSGGIVVDRKTEKIVGILNGTTETTALAVPVETLADFVHKVDPFLAHRIFPAAKEISPVSEDIYPKFVPPRSDRLEHRQDETAEVAILRQKSQSLADSIRNFIAVQSFAWGSGDKDPGLEAAYEIQVINGLQRFRRYPDGKKESDEVPLPHRNVWVLPADDWSQLPRMVGTDFRLKVRQAPDVVMNQRRMKVFQYYADAEDNLCPFQAVGFFTAKTVAVPCYGEVWTDENTNILRISEQLDLSAKLKIYRGWEDFGVVITYGINGAKDLPGRVPLTIYTEARNGKHIYWCRGHFTDYRVFTAQATLAIN